MKKRKLGELEVSTIGLGCMPMSEFYGKRDDVNSVKVIHRAIDLGVDFFDTADCYGAGHNELLLGKALKEKRGEVIVASKFGIVRDPNDPTKRGVRSDRAYVRECVERSLKNLGTDYIDLFYIHRIDKKIPIEETMDEMTKLVEEGKIRHIGLNETHVENIERAHKVYPLTAIQAEYSLYTRFVEHSILPVCEKLNIGFVAYSPLGRGLLTGTIDKIEDLPADDARYTLPRITGENWQHNKVVAKKNKKIAEKLAVTPAQVAIAWLLTKYKYLVPIPGTKTLKYLQENVLSPTLSLSKEDINELDNALPHDGVQGLRYPEAVMKVWDLDE